MASLSFNPASKTHNSFCYTTSPVSAIASTMPLRRIPQQSSSSRIRYRRPNPRFSSSGKSLSLSVAVKAHVDSSPQGEEPMSNDEEEIEPTYEEKPTEFARMWSDDDNKKRVKTQRNSGFRFEDTHKDHSPRKDNEQEDEYEETLSHNDDLEDNGSAKGVVLRFYEAINSRNMAVLSGLVSETCVFHSFANDRTFRGKRATLRYLRELVKALGKCMFLVVENVNEGPESKFVVIWHLEWDGIIFPFPRVCTVVHCMNEGSSIVIREMHDFVEPPLVIGKFILTILGATNSVLERFPSAAKSRSFSEFAEYFWKDF